jgi:hypothetical protein
MSDEEDKKNRKKDKKRSKDKKDREKSKSRDKDKNNEKLFEKRLYVVQLDDKEYSLKVEVEEKYLRFEAHEICDVYEYVYKNKYELNQIVKRLNLVQSKYTSIFKLIKFIDTAYSKNKIYLQQNSEDDLYIIFIVPIDFDEEKYSLHLKKRKLDENEILPMLMEKINKLNNNNAIVKTKFNEIEKQVNTISRKNNDKNGSRNDINPELKIIKEQLNDINGKLYGNKKSNNRINNNHINGKNIMLNSYNSKNNFKDYNNDIDYNDKFYKSQKIEMNKKYNTNKRYDDKEDEKDDSFEIHLNNKKRKLDPDENIKRSIKRSRENEIKRSSRYINNNEEQKFDENDIVPKFRNTPFRFHNENEGMIINKEYDYINNNNEENNIINDGEYNNRYNRKKISEDSNLNEELNDPEKAKVTFVNKNLEELEDYKTKTKFMYNSIPIKLKYRKDICKTNTSCGWNDMFEVYISYQNNKEYLASPNCNTFKIDIYSLSENKKETSLKGHKNNVRTIRYFFHKYKSEKEDNKEIDYEYLISADDNRMVIVWDLLNNYMKKQIIDTNYDDDIYSCALFFNDNTERNYIVTSTYSTSSDISNSATKLYSLETGEFGYYIKESNFDNIYYLLIWNNKKDNQNYLIQFSYKKIIINNLEKGKDEIYAKLIQEPENEHYSGYIYEKDKSDLLCTTCYNGFVHIWDLYTKKLVNIIDTKIIMCHIVPWNEKYAIAADFENKSFVIIDLAENKVFNEIKAEHTMEVKCVKKIIHSEFGESLITAGRDNTIKIWIL